MQFPWRSAVAGALATCLTVHSALYGQDPALLQIRVIEGEGAVHTIGARASQALVVRITDESGRPVAGASVSFRLPDEGPSGIFQTGLRTEVAAAGPDGKVAIRGIQWNRLAGPLQIRITANKGEARSGMVSAQYLTEPATTAKKGQEPIQAVLPQIKIGPSRSKWTVLAVLIGGAAAGGVAAAANRGSRAPGAPPGPPPPAAVIQPSVTIGPPSIAIGKP
jgi:hypothetical protein